MRVSVYPFASTNIIADNLSVINRAVALASKNGARLIVFHECALCGYPPVESKIEEIRREDIEYALQKISVMARRHKIYVAVGTVRFVDDKKFNSIVLFSDKGTIVEYYDKQALWGWDTENYIRGDKSGAFEIDTIKIGFRICFDVRFPELFRDLYKQDTDICFVCFSDTSETPNQPRYDTIKAHLITRAVENIMTVISVNSLSGFQTAPTAVINCNGTIVKEAAANSEELLVYDYIKPETSFGMEGRIVNSDYFLEKGTISIET